jgi:hypothetical protein
MQRDNYRNLGFSQLLGGGGYSDQHLRVSDAERQAVSDRLAEHYAAGRLDQAEFDDRMGQAMNAKTRGDLSGLCADLPDTGAPAVPGHPRYRRRHLWATLPWLWVVFLGVILLFATGTLGRHHHPHQDQ